MANRPPMPRATAQLINLLHHMLDLNPEVYRSVADLSGLLGIAFGTVYGQLQRLLALGWLDERVVPSQGTPGRPVITYRLAPNARAEIQAYLEATNLVPITKTTKSPSKTPALATARPTTPMIPI